MPRLPSTRHVFLGLASLGGGAAVYTTEVNRRQRLKQRPYHPSLDKFDFLPWTLRYKQAVSSTNGIFILEPPHKKPEERLSHAHDQSLHDPYNELWRNGTWSVTIKQPQLQVAREYTPLPSLPPPFYSLEQEVVQKSEDNSGPGGRPQTAGAETNDLRFLIRKDGETSAYIHRQPVDQGDNSSIEVRGPDRALQRYGIGSGDVDEIVFLAGGTGVVPAMQLAHGLLTRKADAYQEHLSHRPESMPAASQHPQEGPTDHLVPTRGHSASFPSNADNPRISILWANRNREECQGGINDPSLFLQSPKSTSSSWKSWFFGPTTPQRSLPPSFSTPKSPDSTSTTNPIVDHLNALRRSFTIVSALHTAHGAQPSPEDSACVSTAEALRAASTNPEQPGPRLEVAYFVDSEGTFISKTQLQDVLSRPSLPHHAIKAGEEKQKKKLIIVSGPDGFVEHFAGSREAVGSRVVQGRVGGVLGDLGREGKLVGWEVVKL